MTSDGGKGGAFDAQDVALLELVLAHHPRVESLALVAKAVSQAREFPIESWDAAHEIWPDGTVEYRGHRMSLDDAKGLLGDDAFPIADLEDLVAKLARAWARAAREAPRPKGPDLGFHLIEVVTTPDDLCMEKWDWKVAGDGESWGTPPDEGVPDDSLPIGEVA